MVNRKAQQLARSRREWFVFVAVLALPGAPRSFVVPRDHVAATTWVVHQDWLTALAVRADTRNATVDRASVRLAVWAGQENRWDLLVKPIDEVPVLLPAWAGGQSRGCQTITRCVRA